MEFNAQGGAGSPGTEPAAWRTVSVVSTKWNGDLHRNTPSLELGSDPYGTWLWMPPGTRAETPSGSFEAIPGLRLIPIGEIRWAYFIPSSPAVEEPARIYIDVTTPNRRTGDSFDFIDLDLDVEVVGAGQVTVLDRDEFVTNAQAWHYPPETVEAAEATCARMHAALTDRQPPFDGTYLHWWWLTTRQA